MKWFLDRIGALRYWAIPSPSTDLGGPDGSQWIIEGEKKGKYKVVDVYTAPATDPIHMLGTMMAFDLAQIKIPPRLIY